MTDASRNSFSTRPNQSPPLGELIRNHYLRVSHGTTKRKLQLHVRTLFKGGKIRHTDLHPDFENGVARCVSVPISAAPDFCLSLCGDRPSKSTLPKVWGTRVLFATAGGRSWGERVVRRASLFQVRCLVFAFLINPPNSGFPKGVIPDETATSPRCCAHVL